MLHKCTYDYIHSILMDWSHPGTCVLIMTSAITWNVVIGGLVTDLGCYNHNATPFNRRNGRQIRRRIMVNGDTPCATLNKKGLCTRKGHLVH